MEKPLRILSFPAFERAQWNPYNALLAFELAALGHHVCDFTWRSLRKERWDIVHIHWPHFLIERSSRVTLWRTARNALARIDQAKREGAKVVWTVHNVAPHEVSYPRLEMHFWRELFSRLDGVIGLSRSGLDDARAQWPAIRSLPAFVIPHGHYRDVYPRPFEQAEARRRLGLDVDATIVGWIGMIRNYKNVPLLIKTFRSIDDPGMILTVSGKPSGGASRKAVAAAAGGDPRVRLNLKFLPDFEIAWQLIACDLVVLPYASIQNSGSALLALSFDRPVVVPALGAMSELGAAVGSDWLQSYEGPFTPDVLRNAVAWGGSKRDFPARLDDFDWSFIAAQTANAFAAIRGSTAPVHREACI